MVARGGDLQRALGPLLAGHVAEVERAAGKLELPLRAGERAEPAAPVRPGHQLAEVAHREDHEPLHRHGLEGVRRRHQEGPRSVAQGRHGHGQHCPRTGRTSPERESSPQRCSPSSGRVGTRPQAASSATAMGRSNPVPSLRRSAGARFTVTRFEGSRKPRFRTAAPTRTSASCTAPPASPVSWVRGKPEAASTSTSTGMAATPRRAEERTRTNIGRGDEQGSCRGRGPSLLCVERAPGRAADRRGSRPAYFILARRSLASAW